MSKGYGVRTRELREVFSASPGENLSMQSIYERMKADGVGAAEERKNIRDTLPWMVRCGYLIRTGRGKDASFQYSGQGMRRVYISEDQRAQHRRELRRQREQARYEQRRGARVGCQAGRIPKPVLGVPTAAPTPETVEQFLARGGEVQRLTTHWEQMEQAA
jgi:hypothetical protein